MDLSTRVALFSFAFHEHRIWLEKVASIAKPEPWGADNKILELYIRANFEIAKQQSKVYEDKDANIAFWRPGYLVNTTSDPLWLVYYRNNRDAPYWKLKDVVTGDPPVAVDPMDYAIKYEPPDFNPRWSIHFQQRNIDHILQDSRNRARLNGVFGQSDGSALNSHLAFRAIYGEIQLKRKEELVIPQWYRGDYQFLMPLFLTQSERVELTAALQPEPTLKRYIVRTLLMPSHAYAYARALVKSRASFADWMMLSEQELSQAGCDEDEQDE